MSAPTLGLLLAVLVVVVGLAAETGFKVALSACQWCFSRRPFLGRRVTPTCSLPGEGDHDGPTSEQPRQYRSSHGRLLSSQPPARRSSDLESAAIVPLTLAAIDPSPNLSAFSAGIELAIFTALFTIGSLLVLNWIIKTMRSSR
jgi:hypothetical protein